MELGPNPQCSSPESAHKSHSNPDMALWFQEAPAPSQPCALASQALLAGTPWLCLVLQRPVLLSQRCTYCGRPQGWGSTHSLKFSIPVQPLPAVRSSCGQPLCPTHVISHPGNSKSRGHQQVCLATALCRNATRLTRLN